MELKKASREWGWFRNMKAKKSSISDSDHLTDEPVEVLPLDYKNIRDCRRIVVLTGAGVSVASGIPPFRGPGGLWNDPKMERLAHREALHDDPKSAWQFYNDLRKVCQNAKPNAAHLALAQFEQNLKPDQTLLLITQNVDGLHQQAGSKNVLEMHGNIHRTKCSNPECSLASGFEDTRTYREPPHCPRCDSILRPDLVMFGEMIPPQVNLKAVPTLHKCDLFIAIGTSGSVYPANRFVLVAKEAGAMTICINAEPPEGLNAFHQTIIGKAEEELPKLLDRAEPVAEKPALGPARVLATGRVFKFKGDCDLIAWYLPNGEVDDFYFTFHIPQRSVDVELDVYRDHGEWKVQCTHGLVDRRFLSQLEKGIKKNQIPIGDKKTRDVVLRQLQRIRAGLKGDQRIPVTGTPGIS